MESQKLNKISFLMIGSGNIAFSLSRSLVESGHTAVGVFSRNKETGNELAEILKTNFLQKLPDEIKADIIFICVSDSEIENIANQITNNESVIVCHSSGSTDIRVLKKHNKRGVFYPMQSIKKGQISNWKNVPIMIEASDKNTEKKLLELASDISNKTSFCNSDERRKYHLAAVILNNFTNHLITLSQDFCNKNSLDFEVLHPLIEKTMQNALSGEARKLQTGPAVRKDKKVINKHLEMLENTPEMKELYKAMSDSIMNYHK